MTSSISKIRKIKDTIKKCTLKGDRLSSRPKNPHSKGLLFSKVLLYLPEDRMSITSLRIRANLRETMVMTKYFIITGHGVKLRLPVPDLGASREHL